MLRASLQSSRLLGNGLITARASTQWLVVRVADRSSGSRRAFADVKKPSINDSRPAVLPGSASAATNEPLPPGPVSTPSSSSITSKTPQTPTADNSIPIESIPLTPPPPPASTIRKAEAAVANTPPASSTPTSTSPPAPTPKPRRILRRLFTTLLLLSIAGFGGGVYYSQINDNFHDFFTEYVPFGEESVLYFEEREFRKRFPKNRPRVRDTGSKVTIPSQSGVSWRVAQNPKASDARTPENTGEAKQAPSQAKPEEKVKAVEEAKVEAKTPEPAKAKIISTSKESEPKSEIKTSPPSPEVKSEPKPVEKAVAKPVDTKPAPTSTKGPEVNEPSRFPTEVTRIDPINIKDANEPVVQDLVKIINDIILVVNADNSNNKFSTTIGKAKSELSKVGGKIKALKDAASQEAENQVKSSHEDFDRAAKELVRRLEKEMQEQEASWKDEYEKERKSLQELYEGRLKSEMERAHEVNEQRLRNELLEQAVEMKRKFVADVKTRVEEERNGRLGKLSDLSNTVNDLEKLTTDWHSLVDANLKTQHLHVAVEAVRSNLESASTPRPFIRELAALKEIAADDEVVNAAISSINPTAYQRGVPSSAHLIDRFRRVAGEVRKASLLPDEAGVASHASSYVLSKLLFKKKGLATGNDVESILTRTETLLEEGNLDGAAREMNGLTGWAKTLSKDWLGEVRKVLEVQQALDVIAAEARLQSLRVE